MFCRNCGNKLENDDRVCTVCGERVDSQQTAAAAKAAPDIGNGQTADVLNEKTIVKQGEEPHLSVDEDIKTPLFNFKWNFQDFPKEEVVKTEDIDFSWGKPKESSDPTKPTTERPAAEKPVVEQMKNAVDPEVIDKTTPFSDAVQKEEPITDDWYEPFSMKGNDETDTMFRFNKKNEEFQELLDREYEKYKRERKKPIVDVNTRRYNLDAFKEAEAQLKGESEAEAKPEVDVKPEVDTARDTVHIPEPDPVVAEKPEEPELVAAEKPEEPELVAAEKLEEPEAVVAAKPEEPEPVVAENPEEPEPVVPEKSEAPRESGIAGMGLFTGNIASPISGTGSGDSGEPDLISQSENISTSVPKSSLQPNGDIPAFIDTSVVSPFGGYTSETSNQTPTASIDNDEYLKDLPTGSTTMATESTQPETTTAQQSPVQPAMQVPESAPAPFASQGKPVSPEIVNEPVIFPFEMDSQTATDQETEQPTTQQAATIPEPNKSDIPKAESPKSEVSLNKPTAPHDEHPKEGTGLIKALIAIIIIIIVLLAGIGIMQFAPNSVMGIILNNAVNSVLSIGTGNAAENGDDVKFVAPGNDLNVIIESQLDLNKNIKQIVYDDSIGYDATVAYEINGANNSVPIENNFWKSVDNGDLLFDEQVIRTVIGYNSSWVDYINEGNEGIFNYVESGSAAEDSLRGESIKEGSSAEYNKLGIGVIRENGNKFYVWTREDITITDKNGEKDQLNFSQLYELEAMNDSINIITVVKL